MSWQPIETGPKDGTYILGWSEKEGFHVFRWRLDVWMSDDEMWNCVADPTHWTPLPGPPK